MWRALLGLMVFPFLLLTYIVALLMQHRQRLVHSAVVAGLVVGEVAAGVAW